MTTMSIQGLSEFVDSVGAFRLPEFCRTMWASDGARQAWEPVFRSISVAWDAIELLSVQEGVRDCALRFADSDAILSAAASAAEMGLALLPLQKQGADSATYSARATRHIEGRPFRYRYVVGKVSSISEFRHAWLKSDQARIGSLLGYPSCCTDFFGEVWVRRSLMDTTWAMALNTESDVDGSGIEAEGDRALSFSPEGACNILWRWLGIRQVPHLPCSFECSETASFGQAIAEVGRRHGFADEIDKIDEILSWPVEWSSRNGIAEIRTPVLKTAVPTDPVSVRHTVQLKGSSYPISGATGLSFPYKTRRRSLVTASKSYQRGLDHENATPEFRRQADWFHTDNGFPTRYAMDRSHRSIVDFVKQVCTDATGGTVVDLGCGNGVLLSRCASAIDASSAIGVEIDPSRAAHAESILSSQEGQVFVGNIMEAETLAGLPQDMSVVLLMPGRLLERDKPSRARLLDYLRGVSGKIIVYAYGDWLTRYGDLEELSNRAGLDVMTKADGGAVATASVAPLAALR